MSVSQIVSTEIDVSELAIGDVVAEMGGWGPVTHSREINVDYGSYQGVGYRVFFENGDSDIFGAPQKLVVTRWVTS